ncbi:hypothetical protein GWL_17470 [Herbaspirillum sp. GW103]|nr:hypothetical protein GWL_17470 [Herbaspirillum sp. GW103]
MWAVQDELRIDLCAALIRRCRGWRRYRRRGIPIHRALPDSPALRHYGAHNVNFLTAAN